MKRTRLEVWATRFHVLRCRGARRVAMAALLGAGLFSAEGSAQAALRIVMDGTFCMPEPGVSNWELYPGLVLFPQGNSISPFSAVCAIPAGPNLVELGSASAHTLESVQVRMKMNTSRVVVTSLWVHDYSSDDYCLCDQQAEEASGNFARTLEFDGFGADCQSCDYDAGWQANVSVTFIANNFGHAPSDRLNILRVRAYDDT